MSDSNKPKVVIEDKYTLMSDIDHVLNKAGVYIGNIYSQPQTYNLYVPSTNMITPLENIGYNAGLLKIFDEILTNPVDERLRESRLFDINNISVKVQNNGIITIRDDGGIPIVIHKVLNIYLPKMIFGILKTSSNYTEERVGAGTNGLGAKLTNIFSKWFRVVSSDGRNKMDICWENNMKDIRNENVTKVTGNEHFTEVSFQIDLDRFEKISELGLATIRIMQKRCIDACAANPGLRIKFESDVADGKLSSEWQFKSFKEFVGMHLNEEQKTQMLEHNTIKDHVVILPNIGYNFGFVNGAVCSKGTHVKKIEKKIVDKVLELMKAKEMELITDRDIKNAISVFVSTSIKNPDYESQSKIELTTPITGDTLNLPKAFLDGLSESVIVANLVEYFQLKYAKEQKKLLAGLNLAIKKTKSKKFTACSNRTDKEKNELFLFEGTSAANGFALYGNPWNQACYELRGKIKNTLNLSKSEIVENVELREIIAILGLQFNDAANNVKNCNFGKIVFATDMDHDGAHICGLLITFFAKHFPELFLANKIYRLISPIIIASKGTLGKDNFQEKYYYELTSFKSDENSGLIKGWDIAYKKGLGSLEDHHYEEMLTNQKLICFKLRDKNYLTTVQTWFDQSTKLRKELLMNAGDGGVSDEMMAEVEAV